MTDELLIKGAISLAFAYLAGMYHFGLNRGVLYPTPLNLFLLYHTLNFAGTIIRANMGWEADRTRLFSMFIGLVAAMAGGALANVLSRHAPRAELRAYQEAPTIDDVTGGKAAALIAVGAVSVLVGFVYVNALGFSAPIVMIREYLTTRDLDTVARTYSNMRIAPTTGGVYIAPGYASQFTRFLLPAVLFITYFKSRMIGTRTMRFVSVLLMILCLYFLASTGVRAYLIVFGAMFAVLMSRRLGPFGSAVRSRSLALALTFVLIAGVFGVLTFLGGRSGRTGSAVGDVASVAWNLLDRVVLITADVQLVAMRHFLNEPRGWGQAWLAGLQVLLPGPTILESTRSSDIYILFHGWGGGNAPPDLWTTLWLEFGWLSFVLVPGLIGYFWQRLHIRTVRGRKSLTRAVILSMAAFTMWEASEPLALFNDGLVTLLLLLFTVRVAHFLDTLLSTPAPAVTEGASR